MAKLSSSEKCFECFAKNGRVFPVERKVLANEDPQSDGAAQPERLVMAVPQADGETASLKARAQVHHAEHPHPVGRNGVFLLHHANLAKAEGFDQLFHHGDVGNGFVGCCARWRCHSGQFLPGQLRAVGAQRHGWSGSRYRDC